MTKPLLTELFALHGDRTSSLATLGGHFETLAAGEAFAVRGLALPGVLVAASEPLAPASQRADALEALARQAAASGRRFLAMPLGRALARELSGRGFHVWQIGSEPVFRLAEHFAPGQEPLARHRIAQALARRGAEVRELDLAALPPDEARALEAEIEALAARWLAEKDCLPLGFLARVEPLAQRERKRFFLLRVRGELQGFVAAAPFRREGRTLGYYFQDMPRRPDARSGAAELLAIEAMRLLAAEGVAEVRLGMAPLARIGAEEPGAGLLSLLHRRWSWGYSFRSVSEFKAKFEPTAWEPLFLASSGPGLGRALADALRAHFPEGLLRPFLHLAAASGGLSLKPEAARILAAPGPKLLPADLGGLLGRCRITLLLAPLFIALHMLRLRLPALDELYRASGYVPGDVTWRGVLLGPLFHNHWFHLLGDQLSFLLFGAAIELLLGWRAYALLLAAGLWLSNPLTHALCWALLSWSAPQAWAATLAEVDYGSSNAVFAMAGALAALLRQWRSVLVPFAVYGLFICYARHSWLALHHLLTLGLGWAGVLLWMALRGRGRAEG